MKRVLLIILITTSVVLYSCNNSEDNPTNSTEVDKGDLAGHIHPRTEYHQTTDTSDYHGCNISLEGTNYSTITDSVGNWIINGIDEGNFTVIYNKNGYSIFKKLNINVKKDYTTTLSQEIYKLTSARLSNLNIQILTGSIKLTATYSINSNINSNYGFHCRFFVSNDSNVLNPLSNYILTASDLADSNPPIGLVTYSYSLSTLYNSGMPSGTKIYVISDIDYAGQYYRENNGKYFYMSMSGVPSNRASIILP